MLDAAAAVKGRLDVKVTLQGNEEMRRSEGVDKDELGVRRKDLTNGTEGKKLTVKGGRGRG